MKKIILQILLVSFFTTLSPSLFSQENNDSRVANECLDILSTEFVLSNAGHSIYLTEEEIGNMNITFIGGTRYRLVFCTELKEQFNLKILDKNKETIFSKDSFHDESYWDFEFESTINCNIEISPIKSLSQEGFVNVLIGFKNK